MVCPSCKIAIQNRLVLENKISSIGTRLKFYPGSWKFNAEFGFKNVKNLMSQSTTTNQQQHQKRFQVGG